MNLLQELRDSCCPEVLGVVRTLKEVGDATPVLGIEVDVATEEPLVPAIPRSLERRLEATGRPPLLARTPVPAREARRDPRVLDMEDR